VTTAVSRDEAAASGLIAEARAQCIVREPQLHERGCALPSARYARATRRWEGYAGQRAAIEASASEGEAATPTETRAIKPSVIAYFAMGVLGSNGRAMRLVTIAVQKLDGARAP